MAGFDIMSLLGGDQAAEPANAVQPPAAQPAAQPPPTAATAGWHDYLSNPSVQAGLLQFGLSALAGGWGSTGQNLAQAIGQGAEAAGANAEVLRKEAQDEEDRTNKRGDVAFEQDYKNRELNQRREIAQIAADSRMNIAQLRVGSGARSLQEQKFFDATYNKVYQGLAAQNKDAANNKALGLAGAELFTDEEMQNIAQRQAQAALEAHRSQFSGGGVGDGTASPTVPQNGAVGGQSPSPALPPGQNSSPPAGNVGASSTRGQSAPDGTTIKLKDGSYQRKVQGKWVPVTP